MKSWEWPVDHKTVATLFLTPGWVKDASDIDFKDMSTVMSLWDNCGEYCIPSNIIKKICENRNTLFAHNSAMQVSNYKATHIFDLNSFIDVKTCTEKLQLIQSEKVIHPDKVKYLLTHIQSDIKKSIGLETEMKEMLVEQQRKIKIILDKVDNQSKQWCYKTVFTSLCVVVAISLLALTVFWFNQMRPIPEEDIRNTSTIRTGKCIC